MRILVATTAVALALLPAANLAQAATTVDTGSQLTASSLVPSTEVDRQATKRANMNDIKMMLASNCNPSEAPPQTDEVYKPPFTEDISGFRLKVDSGRACRDMPWI